MTREVRRGGTESLVLVALVRRREAVERFLVLRLTPGRRVQIG